jgi:hypothetical protein
MLGRKSQTAVIDRDASTTGSRAAEVVGEAASELAERAVAAAQNAQRVATPVLRTAAEKSAETLSHAAERAAVVLADTAERLAESGEAVRPKRRRRFRRMLAVGLIGGAIAAVVKSPLRSKITDRLFGPPPEFEDDTPESITLPASAARGDTGVTEEPVADDQASAEAGGGDSNGVASGSASSKGEGTQG